jgi:hypothetical protein
VILPPALAAIAQGRDHLTTAEFARAIGRKENTVRKLLCQRKQCYGIVPVKFGNKLLWPVDAVATLLLQGPPAD